MKINYSKDTHLIYDLITAKHYYTGHSPQKITRDGHLESIFEKLNGPLRAFTLKITPQGRSEKLRNASNNVHVTPSFVE